MYESYLSFLTINAFATAKDVKSFEIYTNVYP